MSSSTKRVSVEDVQTIYDLHKKGVPNSKIAQAIDKTATSVGYYVRAIDQWENGQEVQASSQFSIVTFNDWRAQQSKNAKAEEPKPDRRVKYKIEVTVWEYQ